MDREHKIDLVKKGQIIEVLTEDELRALFDASAHPMHYIGFEISGKVHLGTGLCTALKIKDFLAAGIKPTILLADYHAWINGKLGGDLDHIQKVAKGYFKSAMQSSLHCAGLSEEQVEKVNFVLASELYEEMGGDYWKDVLTIAHDSSTARMLRCTTIMGRSQSDKVLPSSVFMYPAMQAADIWALDVDIAHAGMDQRKVHVLAREWAEKRGKKKPVAIHGKLLTGLTGPGRMDAVVVRSQKEIHHADGTIEQAAEAPFGDLKHSDEQMIANKMSKSNPNSCIFIHDTPEEIQKKMQHAYCPPGVAEGNPIIEMAEVFILRDKPLEITRPEKFGGNVSISSPAELQSLYAQSKLHPMDLKNAVSRELVEMLAPCRAYFAKHPQLLQSIS